MVESHPPNPANSLLAVINSGCQPATFYSQYGKPSVSTGRILKKGTETLEKKIQDRHKAKLRVTAAFLFSNNYWLQHLPTSETSVKWTRLISAHFFKQQIQN